MPARCPRRRLPGPAAAPASAGGGGGFTLIELLVVIAVIALLIGLLLPALRGARGTGHLVVCLSNQRQIGAALVMYQNDFNVIPREAGISEPPAPLPPQVPAVRYTPGTPLQRNISWPFSLRVYLDARANPTRVDLGLADRYAGAPYYQDPARPKDPHNIHYVSNGLRFIAPGIADEAGKPPAPLWRVIRPASVVYLTDFIDDPNGTRFGAWYAPTNSDLEVSIYYDLWRPTNVNGSPFLTDDTLMPRVAPKRHGMTSNAAYFDGHAASVEPPVITSLRAWDDGDYIRR